MLGMHHGSSIPFETHLERLSDPLKVVMVDLRGFVQSLGSNVIEEVRPHRVVYSKTMNFRIFLDIEPAGDSLVLSIKSGRSAPPLTVTIRNAQEAEGTRSRIAEAYQKIQ
jgi:hypothetical protein